MKNILKKSLFSLALTLTVTEVAASIYAEDYSPLETNSSYLTSPYIDGDFEKILRYDMVCINQEGFIPNTMSGLDKAIEDLKALEKSGQFYEVTLIGYSERFENDVNEKRIASKTYADSIIDYFVDTLDENQSLENTKAYVARVKEYILEQNASIAHLEVEYRGGLDSAYSQATAEGKALSNGVMITIYVGKPQDIDSDKDGIFDKFDQCPATPRGSKVDKNGCPIDSDGDGIIDYKDKCPDTPEGVFVDKKGCPVDSDGDGVVDYKDECPGSTSGVEVDPNGCALKSTLKLSFAPGSDKILTESQEEIRRFAAFLKKNTAYEVEITGHTDSVGKAVVNMDLSQRRAKMTKEALVKEGVEESRLRTKGRGELDPIASNKTKEGRSANRRIEVELFLNEE